MLFSSFLIPIVTNVIICHQGYKRIASVLQAVNTAVAFFDLLVVLWNIVLPATMMSTTQSCDRHSYKGLMHIIWLGSKKSNKQWYTSLIGDESTRAC